MDPIIIPIVALLVPIVIVPTAMGIKHARFLREVEHAERMRAMELGQTLAEDESWTPGSVAVVIGAGLPIVAMLVAFMVGKNTPPPQAWRIEIMWMAVGMIGVAGVICGSTLGAQQFAKRDKDARIASSEEKPAFDPDAFDVVGSRG